MSSSTEARNSISIKALSPEGFELTFTHRDDDNGEFTKSIPKILDYIKGQGFKPLPVRSFGGAPRVPKPIEYVPDEKCPTCGSPLVYFEAKGKKHKRCSTGRYDFNTRTTIGCPFIIWQM